jgi:RNA polymerase sigma-70 factor (ECF subfamily)
VAVTRRKPDNAADADDAAVVARMAAGQQPALAELYDRYSSLLLGVGVRMLGVRAEAEDVLHDVFVEVWKRAADFDPARGTVRAWLALRMRSRCLDRKKSPRVSRSVSFDDTEQARRAAPEQDPLLRLERQRVRQALTALSPEQRAVVDLAYFAGLSTQEIGDQLGVPQGTVKSRLFAARDKLARALGDDDAGPSAKGERP